MELPALATCIYHFILSRNISSKSSTSYSTQTSILIVPVLFMLSVLVHSVTLTAHHIHFIFIACPSLLVFKWPHMTHTFTSSCLLISQLRWPILYHRYRLHRKMMTDLQPHPLNQLINITVTTFLKYIIAGCKTYIDNKYHPMQLLIGDDDKLALMCIV